MKKKTEDMIKYFLEPDYHGGFMYTKENNLYYAGGQHACVQFIDPLSGLDPNVRSFGFRAIMKRAEDAGMILTELPNKQEIKNAIRKLAGRKYGLTVVWHEGSFVVNARYLLKAIEGLNATVCYKSSINPRKSGIMLYENDDLNSDNKIYIMPVLFNKEKVKGFYIYQG